MKEKMSFFVYKDFLVNIGGKYKQISNLQLVYAFHSMIVSSIIASPISLRILSLILKSKENNEECI